MVVCEWRPARGYPHPRRHCRCLCDVGLLISCLLKSNFFPDQSQGGGSGIPEGVTILHALFLWSLRTQQRAVGQSRSLRHLALQHQEVAIQALMCQVRGRDEPGQGVAPFFDVYFTASGGVKRVIAFDTSIFHLAFFATVIDHTSLLNDTMTLVFT